MYKVQSVLFKKDAFTIDEMINFIIENNYKLKKIDIAKNYYRFRQINPQYIEKKGYTKYRTKNIGKNIKLVLAYKE